MTATLPQVPETGASYTELRRLPAGNTWVGPTKIYVGDFAGYDPSGATPSDTALAAALAACTPGAYGSLYEPGTFRLYLGPGVLALANNYAWPNHVDPAGEGKRATTLKLTAAGAGISLGVAPPYGSTGHRHGRIADFFIDGNNIATLPLFLGGGAQWLVESVEVRQSAADGVHVGRGQNHAFVSFDSESHKGHSLVLDEATGGHAFYKCEIASPGVGALARGLWNLVVRQGTGPKTTTAGTNTIPTSGTYTITVASTASLDASRPLNIFGQNNIAFTIVDATTISCTGGGGASPISVPAGSPVDQSSTGGGYTEPTDISFRECLFERGDALGKAGTIYIGNAARRVLFDGCNIVCNEDLAGAGYTGVTQYAVAIRTERNGASVAQNGVTLRECTIQGRPASDANPTIAVSVNGGGNSLGPVSVRGGLLLAHGIGFEVDDLATIDVNPTPRISNIGQVFANAPQSVTGLNGLTMTAGAPNAKPQAQVLKNRSTIAIAASASPPTDATLLTTSVNIIQDGLVSFDTNLLPYMRLGGAHKRLALGATSGLESALPAVAGAAGSFYRADDTGVLFLSDGTTWKPVAWPGQPVGAIGLLANYAFDAATIGTVPIAASGSDTLVGIFIPKNFVVAKIAFRTGGTAATLGTNNDSHWYLVIRDQAGADKASTADQGTAALAAGSYKSINIGRDAANAAASSWTCPASAYYLVGPNVYVGTGGTPVNPTLTGRAAMLASGNVTGNYLSAIGQTGMTTGAPAASSTPAAATVQPWVAVVAA